MKFCIQHGWQKFAILFTETRAADADDFASSLLNVGIEAAAREKIASPGSAPGALRHIKQKRLRIVLLLKESGRDARQWMLDAYDLGMTGKGWAYLTGHITSVESVTTSAGAPMAGDMRAEMHCLQCRGC